MNILYRFLLGIYTFCLAIISLFVVLIFTNIISKDVLTAYSNMIINNKDYSAIVAVIATVFFIISLIFLLSGVDKGKDKSAVEKKSELGNIMISLNSIESIIMSSVKQLDGVMDIKTVLERKKDAVKIKLKVVLTPEHNIPEVSSIIQIRAKEAVERVAGIEVSGIEVLVQDVIQTIKPISRSRVE